MICVFEYWWKTSMVICRHLILLVLFSRDKLSVPFYWTGLGFTGGIPYDILKPVLERATADQLFTLENYNPYLIEDTDPLWEFHCNKEFRKFKREEMDSWRDTYMVKYLFFLDFAKTNTLKIDHYFYWYMIHLHFLINIFITGIGFLSKEFNWRKFDCRTGMRDPSSS